MPLTDALISAKGIRNICVQFLLTSANQLIYFKTVWKKWPLSFSQKLRFNHAVKQLKI